MGGRQPGRLAAVGRRGAGLIDATNGRERENGAAEEAAPFVQAGTELNTTCDRRLLSASVCQEPLAKEHPGLMRDRARDRGRRRRDRRRRAPPTTSPSSASADVLVLDQGPLFETGGSSSHAPGLAFQTNGSRMMCRIAQESVALYATLDVDGEPGWYGVGGIEVATTEARMRELKRRLGFARSYGLEGPSCSPPPRPREKIPLLDPSTILGAYHVPSDGIAKAVTIATALARTAEAKGVGVRRRRDRDRVRRPGRARARRSDRPRERRVRARAAVRRHLGSDRRRDGGCADPARRGAAPAGVDRSGRRARGRDPRGRPPDPATPGHGDVLPSPEGPLRRRELPPRTDRHAPAGVAPARRRTDAVAHAVHARRLRRGRGRGRPPPPGARGADAAGRPRALDQRDVLVHAGRGLDRRGVGERSGRVDLRGRVGDARRRVRQARRRVDRERRALDRHGRGRRQPLLPVHDDAALRARAREAAVPGGVRHPPSAPADGAPAEAPAHALLRAAPRARRRVRHRCGVGAPRVVRGQRRARALRRSVGAPGRLGRAALVADRRRRAPRDPFERGAVRPDAVREARRRGARRARVPRADLREPDRPPGRHDRLHGDAHRLRRRSGAT